MLETIKHFSPCKNFRKILLFFPACMKPTEKEKHNVIGLFISFGNLLESRGPFSDLGNLFTSAPLQIFLSILDVSGETQNENRDLALNKIGIGTVYKRSSQQWRNFCLFCNILMWYLKGGWSFECNLPLVKNKTHFVYKKSLILAIFGKFDVRNNSKIMALQKSMFLTIPLIETMVELSVHKRQ